MFMRNKSKKKSIFLIVCVSPSPTSELPCLFYECWLPLCYISTAKYAIILHTPKTSNYIKKTFVQHIRMINLSLNELKIITKAEQLKTIKTNLKRI